MSKQPSTPSSSATWTATARHGSFDSSGRLLEVVVLRFDSSNELLMHAMKARRQYLDLLD